MAWSANASASSSQVALDERNGMPAARKIMPWGYLTDITPSPFYTGVEKPMKVYSFDNVMITSAKVPDDFVYKILDSMTIAPVGGEGMHFRFCSMAFSMATNDNAATR